MIVVEHDQSCERCAQKQTGGPYGAAGGEMLMAGGEIGTRERFFEGVAFALAFDFDLDLDLSFTFCGGDGALQKRKMAQM